MKPRAHLPAGYPGLPPRQAARSSSWLTVAAPGFITTIHHLGGGFWTYLGGWIFDETGSYHWIFVMSAATALVAVVCTLLIAERRHEALRPGLR